MAESASTVEPVVPSSRRSWMPLWLRALWAAGVLLIIFLVGIVVGMLIERNSYEDKVVLGAEWRELGEVISFLETDSYYRPTEPEAIVAWQEELENGAINGLLDASGDVHAQFMPPAEAARSSARLTGKYEGIGVSIGASDGGDVQVVSVSLDSPADRADVRVGDVIASVNSTSIPVGDTGLAAELLRGDAGTEVSLMLERPGGEPVRLKLTREEIETGEKTVGYRYFPDVDVGVIQISLFATTTVGELDDALAKAREDGADRLVLDLRGNPGGWVSATQGVIGHFLNEAVGPALREDTRPAGGSMIDLPIINGDSMVFDGELIVIVDENSASAAEIVAGALQDHNRATIAGQPSFGKGSVQRVYEFPDGESLRLTIAEWFTPDGRRLQDAGIEPDVLVPADVSTEELVAMVAPVFDGGDPLTIGTPVASPESTPVSAP